MPDTITTFNAAIKHFAEDLATEYGLHVLCAASRYDANVYTIAVVDSKGIVLGSHAVTAYRFSYGSTNTLLVKIGNQKAGKLNANSLMNAKSSVRKLLGKFALADLATQK